MRLSIRAWTILVLDAFVVGVSLLIGWIAQNVAGEAVEERLAKEMVTRVSSFLGNKTFPLSDAMMGYLREMLDTDWIAVEGDGVNVVGSSLVEPQTREFVQRVREIGQSQVMNLGGTQYRVESHDAPANAARGGGPEVRSNPRRLYLLISSAKLQETRGRASRRVAGVVLPVTGAATLGAVLLAFVIAHPVRKLTREMDRLAGVEERSGAAQTADGTPGEPTAAAARADADLRRALIARGPVETRQLAKSFYGLLDQLTLARQRLARHERLATLGKLSLNVAHELRNPLSGIKMNMRVLQDSQGTADDPGVTAILREIDRMELYLNELMTLTPGDNRPEPAAAPVKLSGLVESVLTLMAGRCRHAGVMVRREYPAAEPLVSADANQIRQVLINFMVNALEAMPAGGEVTVALRPGPATVACIVHDTGQGVQMPGADIFEAFVTGKPNGVGLGLYLSKQILQRHSGRIGYENGATGAAFWFELPLDAGGSPSESRTFARAESE